MRQIVGLIRHQEFGSIRISEEDRACGFQSRNQRRVFFGNVILAEKRAGGAGPTGYIDTALDAERHAVKRSESRAARDSNFRCSRSFSGTLSVQMHKRIEFRLQRLDAFEMDLDDFKGRDILRANVPRHFRYRTVGEGIHGLRRESKRASGAGQAAAEIKKVGVHNNG